MFSLMRNLNLIIITIRRRKKEDEYRNVKERLLGENH
jgi:hypothetical protein